MIPHNPRSALYIKAAIRVSWVYAAQWVYKMQDAHHWAKHYAKGEWLRVKREWVSEGLRGKR